jgi:hypothetical protein
VLNQWIIDLFKIYSQSLARDFQKTFIASPGSGAILLRKPFPPLIIERGKSFGPLFWGPAAARTARIFTDRMESL